MRDFLTKAADYAFGSNPSYALEPRLSANGKPSLATRRFPRSAILKFEIGILPGLILRSIAQAMRLRTMPCIALRRMAAGEVRASRHPSRRPASLRSARLLRMRSGEFETTGFMKSIHWLHVSQNDPPLPYHRTCRAELESQNPLAGTGYPDKPNLITDRQRDLSQKRQSRNEETMKVATKRFLTTAAAVTIAAAFATNVAQAAEINRRHMAVALV